MFLILLSNNVHFNPGPPVQNDFFNFMSVNSLIKDNFQCDDSVELPETLLNDYTFVPSNHPPNTRSGGIKLFFKNSLTVVRNYLSFDESIVIELKFGWKKIVFTILYRSPSFDRASPEFQAFLLNFEKLAFNDQNQESFCNIFY